MVGSVIITTVSDAVLDLVAVYVIHGGMFSMGLATSVSYWISAVFLLLFYKKKDAMLKPRLAMTSLSSLLRAAYNGLPMAVSRLTSTSELKLNNTVLRIPVSD